VPDAEVLKFAATEGRILLSHNRRHFLRLHLHRIETHAGMVLCTVDGDFVALAQRIASLSQRCPTWEISWFERIVRADRLQ